MIIEGHYDLDPVKGTLQNLETGNYLPKKVPKNKKQYIAVRLNTLDGGKKFVKLHRLMAETFIPNPENKPTIHHINHDRHDNRVENLEWRTYSEQMDNETRAVRGKAVRVYNDNFEHVYFSAREACRQLGLNQGNLSMVLTGAYSQTSGYKAEYIEE